MSMTVKNTKLDQFLYQFLRRESLYWVWGAVTIKVFVCEHSFTVVRVLTYPQSVALKPISSCYLRSPFLFPLY